MAPTLRCFWRHAWLATAVAVLCVAAPGRGAASEPLAIGLAKDRTYLLQPADSLLQARQLAVREELSFGRRVGRPGLGGFQNRIAAEFAATPWLEFTASGAFQDATGGSGIEAQAGVALAAVDQRRGQPLNVIVRIDGVREHDGTPVLLGGLVLGRRFGAFDVVGSALAEKPFADNRDAVDVVFSLGSAYAIRPWARVGAEATGADIEALWEVEEAEGGARLYAGPTASFDLLGDRRLNAGATVAGGVVTTPRPTLGTPAPKTPTWIARAGVAYTFF